MVYAKCIKEPHQSTIRRRVRVIYVQKMEERRVFMDELTQIRRNTMKYFMKLMKDAVGPIWYHTLSVRQRCALDGLESNIYQDILEGRPNRTRKVINTIGLLPPPKYVDLMAAIYAAEQDPKELFAYLFLLKFGHIYAVKRPAYNLNGKLILSSLFYLGLENLKSLLEETFKSEREEPPPKSKRKPKPSPPPVSPYLAKTFTTKCYLPQPKRKPKPLPLPDLSVLNKLGPVRPPESIPKPQPPAQRPIMAGPSKPRAHCDSMAGVMLLQPFTPVPVSPFKPQATPNARMTRRRISKQCRRLSKQNHSEKKQYGLNLLQAIKKERSSKKPKAPKTAFSGLQYQIVGVYTIHDHSIYILGNIISLPVPGFIIHSGFVMLAGEYVRGHGGCTGGSNAPKSNPCDCLQSYEQNALRYLLSTKCDCGHYYDYNNEVTFSSHELPYFQKSTKKGLYQFHYDQIYELDPRALYVGKEFKRIWDTESLLHSDDEDGDKKPKKKKRHISPASVNCLGDNPQPHDFLKCALESYKTKNIAARLPDVHLTPELREWIRRRVYGDFSRKQKRDMLRKSSDRWVMLDSLAEYSHVFPPACPEQLNRHTSWAKTVELRKRFHQHYQAYRRRLFRVQVHENNILWATMFHEEFPDKSFRAVFFSYLLERMQDLKLFHPYSPIETNERARVISNKRVTCPLTKVPG